MWNCKSDYANNIEKLKNIVDEIIKLIKMKAISDFLIGKGKEDMPGYSVIKMIETSHIALHSFTINNTFMLSVESCKDFDENKLEDYVLQTFMPKGSNISVYDINIPVKVTQEVKGD